MKRHCYWLLWVFLIASLQVSGQNWDWALSSHRAGLAPFSDNDISGMTVNAAGHVFVVGNYVSGIGFGNLSVTGGTVSPFLARLDSNGIPVWLKKAQSTSSAMVSKAIGLDQQDHCIATGDFSEIANFGVHQIQASGFQYDGWLAKMDANGNWLWAKGFGGDSVDRGNAVAVDISDNIYAGGEFSKSAHFDSITVAASGLMDAYLVKLTPLGEVRWVRTCFGSKDENINKIVTSASGHIYVAGSFEGTSTIFGQQLTAPLALRGQNFIAKLDSLGNTVWVQPVGCPTYATGHHELKLAIDLAGNVYFAAEGYTPCFYDSIAINYQGRITYFGKLNPQGSLEWLRYDPFPISNSQQVQFLTGIAVADNGDVIVTGSAQNLSTVDYCNPYALQTQSYFMIYTDSAGNCVCFEKFKHLGQWMQLDADEMWMSGSYLDQMELSPLLLQAADSNDVEAFVAHRSRNCTPVTAIESPKPTLRLTAYPNPSDGNFWVTLLGKKETLLRIVDVFGRQILEVPLHSTQPTPISNLPVGIYLLEADGPEFLRMKVVVQK